MEHEQLTYAIIGAALRVSKGLVPGYLEAVYRRALAWELRERGLSVECERRLQVRYRTLLVGEYVADMVVESIVLVEIKACRTLLPVHETQLVNYLTTTGLDVGLLLNFGAPSLEFRRRTRVLATGA